MEPMNCTAWVKGDESRSGPAPRARAPNQGIWSQVASVAPQKVKINTLLLGGGFGHAASRPTSRSTPRCCQDQRQASEADLQPRDDMAAAVLPPRFGGALEGAVDDKGNLTMLKAGVGSPSIMATSGFMQIPPNGIDSFAVEGLADHLRHPEPAHRLRPQGPGRRSGSGVRWGIRRTASSAKASSTSWRRWRARTRTNSAARCWAEPAPRRCSNWPRRRPAGARRCPGRGARHRRGLQLPTAATWPRWPRSRWAGRREGAPRGGGGRLRAARQPADDRAPDRESHRLRPFGGAVRKDHPPGRRGAAGQLQHLPGAAHERDAEGGGAHRAEHRSAGRRGEPGTPPVAPAVAERSSPSPANGCARCRWTQRTPQEA